MKRYLLLLLPAILVSGYFAHSRIEKPVERVQVQVVEQKPAENPPTIEELWRKVNDYRNTNGLPSLLLDERLNRTAERKCSDMSLNNYWSHDTPEGSEPWRFIQTEVDYYENAGENLAFGYKDSVSFVQGWIESEGHKANLLNRRFTNVGYSICKSNNYIGKGEQTIVVQHFISE